MSNVIQFPKKQGTPKPKVKAQRSKENPDVLPVGSQNQKWSLEKVKLGGAVLAFVLISFAVNQKAFNVNTDQINVTEMSSVNGSRAIASVGPQRLLRDNDWEKEVAEGLASANVRGPATFNVGREATAEEKIRFGLLGGVYTLQFSEEGHFLRGIQKQDVESEPKYLKTTEFFADFGHLIDPRFKEAQLLGIPSRDAEKVYQTYQIIDLDNRPVSQAKIELDLHGRFLSFSVSELN